MSFRTSSVPAIAARGDGRRSPLACLAGLAFGARFLAPAGAAEVCAGRKKIFVILQCLRRIAGDRRQ